MLWEEVKEIISGLRQKDSVRIEFCYASHGDAVFIEVGSTSGAFQPIIVGSGSGDRAFEDALRRAHTWLGESCSR